MNQTWEWQNWSGLPYLTCKLLENWQHGFFTQQFSGHPPETLVAALHPEAEVFRVKQVHGNQVLIPSEITHIIANNPEIESNLAAADGIVTEDQKQAVWVASADCTPVLIGDIVTGQVAAVHAGWRGTAQKIVPVAIARLLNHGSKLDNLRIALGPAISGQVYQVTAEVAAQVGATIIAQNEVKSQEHLLNYLKELPNSPILDDNQPGKVRLDVRAVNILQIENLGISREQIAIAPYCTYQQPEHFFSYRRTNEKKVQWSGIVSN